MKKHILIVDDEVNIRELLGQFLSQSGYRVTGASNTGEAQRVIAADPPQLLISDLQLEDSDGLEIIKALKISHPDMPTLLLTGVLFDPGVVLDLLSHMGTSYLHKTVTLERILTEVRHLIGE